MGRSVAFFRNLNLGQGWAPTRPQLVGAFERAGATDVQNVQVNGTVIFSAEAPVRTVRTVLDDLAELTGYADIVVVRSAAFLRSLADRLTALDVTDGDLVEVALFDARPPLGLSLPWSSPDGLLDMVAGDHRHVVCVFHPDGVHGSNASKLLQDVTGVKVTSRSSTTMLRVAARLGLS
jgi:uncharacterized protein (DUF1697 family)